MSHLFFVVLALLAPLALAHTPAGAPDPLCGTGAVHDYAGVGGNHFNPYAPFAGPLPAALDGALANPLCPGGDGHAEHAAGGATLAVESGDGVTGGSLACLGEAGHHGATVQALDAQGFGPFLHVLADHSRSPPASGPDCGDGILEPCLPGAPPPPSPWPYPLDMVTDTVDGLVYGLLGPGTTCNPLDSDLSVRSTALGPSGASVPFPPGADGAYHVVLVADWLDARVPAAGHVWTA